MKHQPLEELEKRTQTATLSLPVAIAKKVLKLRLKSVCRLKELIEPKKCFRCLEFGRMAKESKNCDRSDLCRKCGEKGHMAKSCEKEPRRMLCKEKGHPTDHIAGSSRCPLYRRALNSPRRRK